jgi:serine/threonine protein kinase
MASGSTSSSNVVGVHYRVGKKIGEGSFGVIFEGTNLLNQQQVAIKFEPRKSDAPQLRDEYRTYKILVGCRKFPLPLYQPRVLGLRSATSRAFPCVITAQPWWCSTHRARHACHGLWS